MSITLEHLSYVYNPGTAYEKHALKDVSLEIPQGSVCRDYWTYRFRKIHSDPASERIDESNLRKAAL